MLSTDFGEAVWVDGEGVEGSHEEDRGRVVAGEEEGFDRVGSCLEDFWGEGVGVMQGKGEDGAVFGLAGCSALGGFDLVEAGLDGVADDFVGSVGEEYAADAGGDVGPVPHESFIGIGSDEAFEAFDNVVGLFWVVTLSIEFDIHDDGSDDVKSHVGAKCFHLNSFSGLSNGIEFGHKDGCLLNDGRK